MTANPSFPEILGSISLNLPIIWWWELIHDILYLAAVSLVSICHSITFYVSVSVSSLLIKTPNILD